MSVDPYNYKWYMSLTYDQWSRSGNWILTKMQADLKVGKLTEDQFKAIMKQRDQVYTDRMNQSSNWQTIQNMQPTSGPGDTGSASLPVDSGSGGGFSLSGTLGSIGDAISGALGGISNAASSAVSGVKGAVSGASNIVPIAIGGGFIVFLILIFKRR